MTITCVTLGAAGAWWGLRARGPEPPRLADMGAMDPDIAAFIAERIDRVSAARSSATAWGALGNACEANGLVGAARDAYNSATLVDGSNPKWWYRLASTEMRLGRSDEAIRDVQRAIELDPVYAPAHWRLGLWLLDHDDADGAEREFTRAAELEPENAASTAGLARVYLQRRQEQRAIDLLERALARQPGDRYLLQLLGTAYRRVGRVDEAEFALAVGERGEPAWADAWTDEMLQNRRGFAVRLKDATAYFLAGQTGPAISLLEQLQHEKPDDVALLSHLGEVYVAAGRLDRGIEILEAVVAKDPDRFDAWVNLASGYMKHDDLARARAAIARAIAINSGLGRAYETQGLILWRSGDERAALDALRTAVGYDPRDVGALVYAGMVEMNLERPADAIATFVRATRLDPTRVDAWVGVANAAMTIGAGDRAAAALTRATQLNPEDPGVKQATLRFRSLRR